MEPSSQEPIRDIGDRFQQQTKYYRDRMLRGGPYRTAQPDLYKTYPDCETVALADFNFPDILTVLEAVGRRKSIRHFRDSPITGQQLSCLLWASSGIARQEHGYAFRTAPSAGALYPIETYLAVNQVQEIQPGIYHYNIPGHTLEPLSQGAQGGRISQAALGQTMCEEAAVVFIYSAVFQRSRWKYGQRAYRYIYLDAGHIAENLALTAAALGLGSCQIGALFDDECNDILKLDGVAESVIYMSVVGNLQ